MTQRCGALALVTILLLCGLAQGDDWPQWLGPKRDGVWRESGLLEKFPDKRLKVLWRAPVAGGYAGPAVADGRVFVTDHILRQEGSRPRNPYEKITQPGIERVQCLDQSTGKVLWTHEYECAYGLSFSAGPRTTPAVDGDRVYTLGAEGDLLCLKVADGSVLWSKHLSGPKSPTPMWGFAAHPLVDGKKLIVLTCGNDLSDGHGLVTAFDKMTGQVIWTALAANPPGYCPPMIYQVGAVRQLIIWEPKAVHGLDPETGKVYWSEPFGPVNNGVSITTPRFVHDSNLGDLLMVSSAGEGAMMLKLDSSHPAASILWKRRGKSERRTDALHSLMSPPILRDGHIYGVDIQGYLRCLDLKTGDRIWDTFAATTGDAGPQSWATAFLIPLGDSGNRYLIANEHGDLILADMTPAGYKEISRTHLLDPTNTDPGRPVLWCFPALAHRCIFWRNDKEMVCASMDADGK